MDLILVCLQNGSQNGTNGSQFGICSLFWSTGAKKGGRMAVDPPGFLFFSTGMGLDSKVIQEPRVVSLRSIGGRR